MIDGQGDADSDPEYPHAVEALFSESYTTKFKEQKAGEIDDAVMPLEGLWWSNDLSAVIANDRSKREWPMIVTRPDFVDEAVIHASLADVGRKKALSAMDDLRLESFSEGLCSQILHIGPFSEEGPTIQRVHDFIRQRTALTGKHHNVYLSDVRRAEPAGWTTIFRQPLTRRPAAAAPAAAADGGV